MRRRSLLNENNKKHDYVEIGGIKWATMNVGATAVTDSGLYFQWGDTQGYTASQVGSGNGKKYFGAADYKFNTGTGTSLSCSNVTKYNRADGLIALESEDDAAQVAWGSDWIIAPLGSFNVFTTGATSAWTTDYQGSGVAGLVLTSITDSSQVLFLPAAGRVYNGSRKDFGTVAYYWYDERYSGSQCSNAYGPWLSSNSSGIYGGESRYFGRNIRPIYIGE